MNIFPILIMIAFTAYCLYESNNVYDEYKENILSWKWALTLIVLFNSGLLMAWVWVLSA